MWEVMNPGMPWLSPSSIAYCERVLTNGMQALEFGSGRSTAWFAQRVRHLTSVEHSEEWYRVVRRQLEERGIVNVDYRLVLLDHPEAEPEQDAYSSVPRYVAILSDFSDAALDLVIVDGHYRSTCIRACARKLAPGGLLLVDDIGMWGRGDGVPVPKAWALVHRSGNGIKETAIWQKPLVDQTQSPQLRSAEVRALG